MRVIVHIPKNKKKEVKKRMMFNLGTQFATNLGMQFGEQIASILGATLGGIAPLAELIMPF